MGVSFFITFKVKQKPQITSITPPIGAPGDLVIIKGKDFGENKNTSYVEFGGSRLTASSYISWSDTEIKLVLPANIQDGLVFVGTKDTRSKPVFFANATSVPVALLENTVPNFLPRISPKKQIKNVSTPIISAATTAISKPYSAIVKPTESAVSFSVAPFRRICFAASRR